MKISPLVRRKEQHQRNIHRLMHEGREVEVMRRRGVATVMDTSEEGDEEDEEGGMAGVVFTGTSIQQAQSALDVSLLLSLIFLDFSRTCLPFCMNFLALCSSGQAGKKNQKIGAFS
jgi:hypothetical protein